jgi:hypothetical protein
MAYRLILLRPFRAEISLTSVTQAVGLGYDLAARWASDRDRAVAYCQALFGPFPMTAQIKL